jgi:hypothetical protein
LAVAFAFANAGMRIAARIPMMAMTTSNSMRVKPRRHVLTLAVFIWKIAMMYQPSAIHARGFSTDEIAEKRAASTRRSPDAPRSSGVQGRRVSVWTAVASAPLSAPKLVRYD